MERRTMFDAFERLYEDMLSQERSREETFSEASIEYECKFGFAPYKNFDSFKACRSRFRSRKHKRQ
jgi:hypothetical protein